MSPVDENLTTTDEKEICINTAADEFYTTLSGIIKATTIKSHMTKSVIEEFEGFTREDYLAHDIEYPVQAKLAAIDVELEDGSIISYFDLPEEEKEVIPGRLYEQPEMSPIR